MLDLAQYPLAELAGHVGTPFYLYDAQALRVTLAGFARLVDGPGLAGRYAMKANSARAVLECVREAGLWIDAVSGNEVLRALRAGFPGGSDPPVILVTSDVFRDNALSVVLEQRVLPSVGSPGMVQDLSAAGYRGPISVRPNPGFGHGHVQSCDTGGPSSKHGIWPDDLPDVRREAAAAALRVVGLNVHVGTGPGPGEFDANMRRLVEFFEQVVPEFPEVEAVNFGGGLPHPYQPGVPAYDLGAYRPILEMASRRLARAAGHPIRVEVEPGRYLVAGMAVLVARVTDVKRTRTNAKGPGHTFVMVDAGFCDLVRPAMYGAYHHIEILGKGSARPPEPCVVAGPLCESGDVFTRDANEFLAPRLLPRPEPGDFLVLQDAGAYGAAMSSNYLSIGRVPQVLWDAGSARLIARRESVDDVVRVECDVLL
ncbi:MAG TPA: diaminopimelate decarboxylase [Candidatus Methylomirabilis sp.]|nr:diaminopimelate decarboxylase [Candidatus Methylomirabilis sp.]